MELAVLVSAAKLVLLTLPSVTPRAVRALARVEDARNVPSRLTLMPVATSAIIWRIALFTFAAGQFSAMFTPSTVPLLAAVGDQSARAKAASVFSLFCGGNLLCSPNERHLCAIRSGYYRRRLARLPSPRLGTTCWKARSRPAPRPLIRTFRSSGRRCHATLDGGSCLPDPPKLPMGQG